MALVVLRLKRRFAGGGGFARQLLRHNYLGRYPLEAKSPRLDNDLRDWDFHSHSKFDAKERGCDRALLGSSQAKFFDRGIAEKR